MAAQLEQPTERHYFCKKCEVYGKGSECWLCGSKRVQKGHTVVTQGSHHYDPERRQASCASGLLTVDRRIHRIV